MYKLKCCPKCGAFFGVNLIQDDRKNVFGDASFTVHKVECNSCGYSAGYHNSPVKAQQHWNAIPRTYGSSTIKMIAFTTIIAVVVGLSTTPLLGVIAWIGGQILGLFVLFIRYLVVDYNIDASSSVHK